MQLSKRQLAYLLQQQFNAPTLDQYIKSLGPAAWFRMDQGVTVTGAGISQVDDLSGNARYLLDPGTTRPIYLPFSGTRYLYLPGVAGNYASTPDSVANSITGDIDIRVRVALDDWTPATIMGLIGKRTDPANRSFRFNIDTGGTPALFWSADGSTELAAGCSAATGITDGVAAWVRVTLDVDDGAGNRVIKFYTAEDSATEPTSWAQLGNTVTTAGTTSIFNGNAVVEIGSALSGTTHLAKSRTYRAIIKSGIDGTTVVDFNPADASDGATSFASSATGETWTVNSSGSLPAQIVGRASALFNGTSHYLKTAAFTLNQPTWVIWVGKQVSWTLNDRICDGNTVSSGAIAQNATTPELLIFAGTTGIAKVPLTVGALGVVSAVFSGANSRASVNLSTEVTGQAGAGNMGGLTLGANGDATAAQFSNISTSELIVFPFAPSTELQARLIAGLMARHGLT